MKNDRIPAAIYFVAAVLWAVAAARCFVIGRAAAGVMWIAACAGSIGAAVFMLRRASLNKKPAYIKISGAGLDDAFGEMTDELLRPTDMLNFSAPCVTALVEEKGWTDLDEDERIQAIYDYVADEINYGFSSNKRSASGVLEDGFGQSNSKATLFMALLRCCHIACKLHGFTVDKSAFNDILPGKVSKSVAQNPVYMRVIIPGKSGEYEFTPAGKDSSLILLTSDLGEFSSPDDMLAGGRFTGSARAAAYDLAGRHIANFSIKKSEQKDEDKKDENT